MSALAPLPTRLWNSARIWVQLPRERRLPFWPVERTAAIVGDALVAQVEFVEAIPLTRYGKHLPFLRTPGAPEAQP